MSRQYPKRLGLEWLTSSATSARARTTGSDQQLLWGDWFARRLVFREQPSWGPASQVHMRLISYQTPNQALRSLRPFRERVKSFENTESYLTSGHCRFVRALSPHFVFSSEGLFTPGGRRSWLDLLSFTAETNPMSKCPV